MAALLDALTGLVSPETVNQIAGRLGESDASVSRGLQSGVSSVLAGLSSQADDPGWMRRLFDLVTSQGPTAGARIDLGAVVRGLTPGATSTGIVGTLLSTLFGGRTNEVGEAIATDAGLVKSSSRSSILALAATLVLGFFGREAREGRLTLASLTRLLVGERESIRAVAPAGVLEVVDAGLATPHGAWSDRRATAASLPPPQQSTKWLWPAVVGAAVLALSWTLLNRVNNRPQPSAVAASAVIDSALASGRRTVDSAAGTLATTVRKLDFAPTSLEGQLVAFIEDKSRPIDATTWFDFGESNFAVGSARILPTAQTKIDNVAAILAAYPSVKVQLGGYTDDTGDDGANLRLSNARANAVRDALIAKGIAGSRLDAEGYGEQHPVADNATVEGRARNRRVAVRVTEK